jgi:DinB family protein
MMEIDSKDKILAALKDSNQRAANWFQEIQVTEFFTRHGEVWSPSDNLDHLIKAVKPITKALKLPRITLQAMFGKPEKVSVSYEELCQLYRDVIAKGGQAAGRYLPEQKSPVGNAEAEKRILLEGWTNASGELVSVAEKWQEADLDQYRLPHLLLGKLTIREMLYFTIYHNLRHASQEGD